MSKQPSFDNRGTLGGFFARLQNFACFDTRPDRS